MDQETTESVTSKRTATWARRKGKRTFDCQNQFCTAVRVLVTLAPVLLAGCSSDKAGSPVFPVRGKVVFEGEPASGAFVVFHPKSAAKQGEDGQRPSAQVRTDGSFELSTRSQADGAPAGDYAVTVQWNKLVKQGNDASAGPNVIPLVYAQPDSTPLKVTINQSSNQLAPFEITRRK